MNDAPKINHHALCIIEFGLQQQPDANAKTQYEVLVGPSLIQKADMTKGAAKPRKFRSGFKRKALH